MSETEAQDRLHDQLQAAAAGARIAITADDGRGAERGPADTDRGQPENGSEVARPGDDEIPEQRQRAKERLIRWLRSQTPTGEPRDWKRDELYDDD